MDDLQIDDAIDNWYMLGEKLRGNEPKIVLAPTDNNQKLVQVYFKNSGNPCLFKMATTKAFLVLKEKGLLEEVVAGHRPRQITGWQLNKAGRNLIGKFDATGKPKPLLRGRAYLDTLGTSKQLPINGTPRSPWRR